MSKVKRWSTGSLLDYSRKGSTIPSSVVASTDYDAALALLKEALESVVALDELDGEEANADTLVIAIRELIDE